MKDEKKFEATLSPTEARVYAKLRAGEDRRIADLYVFACDPERAIATMPLSQQQQYVGAIISRINKKLKGYGHIIKPGEARQTYRLWPVARRSKATI